MRGSGQVGSSGPHVQQLVVLEPEIGPEVTMLGFHVLAVQLLQRVAEVRYLFKINSASNNSIK